MQIKRAIKRTGGEHKGKKVKSKNMEDQHEIISSFLTEEKEITVGSYSTKYHYMCPSASNLLKNI